MIDFLYMSFILFAAGMNGQIIDILLNFKKNNDDIRWSDNTKFDESTSVFSIFIFYLKSRQVSIFTTSLVLFFLSFMGNVELSKIFFPAIEGRAIVFFLLGYGGQQMIRDFIGTTSKKVLKQIETGIEG